MGTRSLVSSSGQERMGGSNSLQKLETNRSGGAHPASSLGSVRVGLWSGSIMYHHTYYVCIYVLLIVLNLVTLWHLRKVCAYAHACMTAPQSICI